jgi:hypothetical protein
MYLIPHIAYLTISLSLTVWVAHALKRNARVFLLDIFQGDNKLADSVNRLLVAAFYLTNLGYVVNALSDGMQIDGAHTVLDRLCGKIGGLLLMLGLVHFVSLYLFNRLRKRGDDQAGRHAIPSGWSPDSAPLGKVLD